MERPVTPILAITASLELAANSRADVVKARVRPVSGQPEIVLAEIRQHDGTTQRSIETLAHKLIGRTHREILDDWLGREPDPKSNLWIMDLPPCPTCPDSP